MAKFRFFLLVWARFDFTSYLYYTFALYFWLYFDLRRQELTNVMSAYFDLGFPFLYLLMSGVRC